MIIFWLRETEIRRTFNIASLSGSSPIEKKIGMLDIGGALIGSVNHFEHAFECHIIRERFS